MLDRVQKRGLNCFKGEGRGEKVVPNFGAQGDGWEGAAGWDLDCVRNLSLERGDEEGRGISEVWDTGNRGKEVLI